MPSAIEYVPPTDIDRSHFNSAQNSEFTKRKDAYEQALKYYDGTIDTPFSEVLDDPEYSPEDDDTIINLVKMGCNRTSSFMFPELPRVQTDPASLEDTEEEKWLKEQFLEKNGGLQTLIKWVERGFLAGHTWLWVKPKKPVPRLVLMHPLSVTAFWAADDVSSILWYEQRFFNNGVVFIRDFVIQSDDTWKIYLYKADTVSRMEADKVYDQITSQGGTFSTINYDVVFGDNFTQVGQVAIHRSVIPPILSTPHLPHPDNFYGAGEFSEKNLLDKINLIASVRTRIIRTTADPIDFLTGAGADEIESRGNLLTVANPNAKVTRLSLSSDLLAVNSTLENLIEQFLGIMRVVILKGEAKDLQRVTNAAVRTLFLDALAKNDVLWAAYKDSLSKACRLALEFAYSAKILEIENPKELDVILTMKSPLPTDLSEVANINALALNGKYRSRRTAATKMGDDYAFEIAAMDAEFEEDLEKQEALPDLENGEFERT